MGRPKKNTEQTELSVPSEVKISPLAMPDAINMMREMVLQDNPEFTGDLEQILGARTIGYLYARINGLVHHEAVELCNVSPVEVEMWSKKPEFSSILNVLKSAEATLAESKLWRNVIDGDGTGLSTFFALKSRKAEYKDNAPPATQSITNVRISIDGQDFNTSANFKIDESGGNSERED